MNIGNNNTRWMALAAILIAVFNWGLSFLSIKVTVAVIPPMTLALLRFILATGVLYLIMKWREPNSKLSRRHLPLMVWSGVIGVTLYFYFENNGVKLITASESSIIISVIPVLSLVAETVFDRRRLQRKDLASVALSVLGVYLVVGTQGTGEWFSGSGLGYLMMLGAALAWVVYMLITRPFFKEFSQLAIVYYQTLFGTIALLPLAFLERTEWQMVNGTIIWNVVFLGLFCSALSYYLYVYALDKLGVGLSSLFLNLIPVVAVIAAFIILKETLSWLQISGGLMVIAAVAVAGMETPGRKTKNEYQTTATG